MDEITFWWWRTYMILAVSKPSTRCWFANAAHMRWRVHNYKIHSGLPNALIQEMYPYPCTWYSDKYKYTSVINTLTIPWVGRPMKPLSCLWECIRSTCTLYTEYWYDSLICTHFKGLEPRFMIQHYCIFMISYGFCISVRYQPYHTYHMYSHSSESNYTLVKYMWGLHYYHKVPLVHMWLVCYY